MPPLMRIGRHLLKNNLIVAPMAGVTDRPFRQLCKRHGRGHGGVRDGDVEFAAVRLGQDPAPRQPRRRGRPDQRCRSPAPIPAMMAEAARYNVDRGAQIIDINMGCPAKKVCNVMAGSALLQDEALVGAHSGSRGQGRSRSAGHAEDPHRLGQASTRNALQHPENRRGRRHPGAGDARPHPRLRLHRRGRIRHHPRGEGSRRDIPIIANGDITTPEKARYVLEYTGADAVMIGRAAQGRPWIFREIEHFLQTGAHLPPPRSGEIHAVLLEHICTTCMISMANITGVRVARKHISWYTRGLVGMQRVPPRHEPARHRWPNSCRCVNEYFAQAARADNRLRYETSHDNNNAEDMPAASRLAA